MVHQLQQIYNRINIFYDRAGKPIETKTNFPYKICLKKRKFFLTITKNLLVVEKKYTSTNVLCIPLTQFAFVFYSNFELLYTYAKYEESGEILCLSLFCGYSKLKYVPRMSKISHKSIFAVRIITRSAQSSYCPNIFRY